MKAAISIAGAVGLLALAGGAWAFNSGSTGADGPFNPLVNTELQVPPSGVFNFTTVNIPAGVTVTFKRNATNTPVVLLATGDVTIAGAINLNGTAGRDTGPAGDGVLGDDGQPGVGGPGGYDGGRGGITGGLIRGGNGLGPGGGSGSNEGSSVGYGGAGGGFGGNGEGYSNAAGGTAYGSPTLLPLVGGSGGGGGRAGSAFNGAGGGGGGGAIMIASSGTVTVTGSITANGGGGGSTAGSACGGPGGGGSGGAIRILATRLTGNGPITAAGASYGTSCSQGAGNGSGGRIRLEAEILNRTTATTPTYSASAVPGPVFVAGLPTLRIARIGGFDVPAVPTSEVDVSLPADFPNPVTVEFAATGVPVGNTVSLRVVPAQGATVIATSPALTGTSEASSASVAVDISSGPSVLQASTTYNIVVAQGEALSRYAMGERVEKIRLDAAIGELPVVTLITVSGKEYPLPAAPQPIPGS